MQHPCRWGRKGLAYPLVIGGNATVALMDLRNRNIGRLMITITIKIMTNSMMIVIILVMIGTVIVVIIILIRITTTIIKSLSS